MKRKKTRNIWLRAAEIGLVLAMLAVVGIVVAFLAAPLWMDLDTLKSRTTNDEGMTKDEGRNEAVTPSPRHPVTPLPLLPHAVNEILGRIGPDMPEGDAVKILKEYYPDAQITSILWSGQTGCVDFQLTSRFTISFPGRNDPNNSISKIVHWGGDISVYDSKLKRRIGVSYQPDDAGKAAKRLLYRDKDPDPFSLDSILAPIPPDPPFPFVPFKWDKNVIREDPSPHRVPGTFADPFWGS